MSATVLPLCTTTARSLLPSFAPADEAPGPMRILEQAGLGIALVQQRRITSCNQYFAELYGFDVQTAILICL